MRVQVSTQVSDTTRENVDWLVKYRGYTVRSAVETAVSDLRRKENDRFDGRVTIPIAQIGNKEQAAAFIEKVHGQTYLDFQVSVTPSPPGHHVSVQTNKTGSVEEARGLLNHLLFTSM